MVSAGRGRWKIENEGFNIQKNGGFNLEHAYSTGDWQIKNFYVLLQIAHLLLQLIGRGSLLTREAQKLFGSLRGMARRLLESIRNVVIPADATRCAASTTPRTEWASGTSSRSGNSTMTNLWFALRRSRSATNAGPAIACRPGQVPPAGK